MDPEIIALGAAVLMVLILNRFRFFFVLSARGNLLWTGAFTFLTVDLYLRRDGMIYGVQNSILCAVCGLFTVLLIVVPDLIPSLLRRG